MPVLVPEQMSVRVLVRMLARVRRLPRRVRLHVRQVPPRCISGCPDDTSHRTPVEVHARAYVESAHPPGSLAFEWTCAEQAALKSAKARVALATESVPVPEQVVTRVQDLRVARVMQSSALPVAWERAPASAPVQGGTVSSPLTSRARCSPATLNESPLNACSSTKYLASWCSLWLLKSVATYSPLDGLDGTGAMQTSKPCQSRLGEAVADGGVFACSERSRRHGAQQDRTADSGTQPGCHTWTRRWSHRNKTVAQWCD